MIANTNKNWLALQGMQINEYKKNAKRPSFALRSPPTFSSGMANNSWFSVVTTVSTGESKAPFKIILGKDSFSSSMTFLISSFSCVIDVHNLNIWKKTLYNYIQIFWEIVSNQTDGRKTSTSAHTYNKQKYDTCTCTNFTLNLSKINFRGGISPVGLGFVNFLKLHMTAATENHKTPILHLQVHKKFWVGL